MKARFSVTPDLGPLKPNGVYAVSVRKAKLTYTQAKPERRMAAAEYRITGPEESGCVGQVLFDNFVLGTDDDPEADKQETWVTSIGIGSLKRYFTAVGQDADTIEDVEDALDESVGAELLVRVVQKADRSDPKNVRNNVTRYYAVGDVVAELDENPAVLRPAAAKHARSADNEAAAPEPAAPQPARRAAGAVANPSPRQPALTERRRRAQIIEEADEEED